MTKNKFYITTTLPYVNSEPHVGFALEIIRADVIARYKKLIGHDVFFNTGTDEHGIKIYKKALELGIDVQKYVDQNADKFKALKDILGLSPDIHFIRTTDKNHIASAQAFWKICFDNGYIYKKNYKIKYCIGCELEKTDSELVDGKCEFHPNQAIEIIDEENYFFTFSKFQKALLALYESNPDFVVPDFRFNEIKAFVGRGLEDFSISRLKSKMPWGVPVPNDENQVMYVWFDALVNYISTIGWPNNIQSFTDWWPVTQYCGKDNLRQQSAMWQAMLMACSIPPSKQIVVNGFITGDGGIKMSKSLGNVINPLDVVNTYGTEALRYFVTRELHPFEDGPFTMERFKEVYNANLANGIGNLASRILKMSTVNEITVKDDVLENSFSWSKDDNLESFNIKAFGDDIWREIGELDKSIQDKQPFKLIKTDFISGKKEIESLLVGLYRIAKRLEPIMPITSSIVKGLIKENRMPDKPLFLRKD